MRPIPVYGFARAKGNHNRKLVLDQIVAICQRYKAGEGCVELAEAYGVTPNVVLHHLRKCGVTIRKRGGRQ